MCTQQLPNRSDIVVTSVADNVSIIAPVALMLIVDAAIVVKASRDLHMHVNDQRIDLQGSTTQRDTTYELFVAMDQRIADWVVRPDISGSPDDIAILFGVLIYADDVERVAYDACLQRVVNR